MIPTQKPLFKHQIDSIQFFLNATRGLDLSDPGTGKTRVQIEVFKARRKRGGGKALVLAPKSLLESAWLTDFRQYAPDMRVSVAHATNRAVAFTRQADVYVTNTDAVRWLVKQPAAFFKDFDTLIVDEVSYFKHHTSQRSRALNKLKAFFPFRFGLSGTPNANTITDVWHPAYVIDDGERLGKSFFHFRASVCTPKQVGPQPNMIKWTDKPGAETAVAGLLRDLVIRHKFEECIDIPDNHEYSVPYQLSSAQMKTYQQMEDDALAQLKNGEIVSAINAAAVVTKLLQIASGAVYTSADAYSHVDAGRYELIADLVEARKSCLVFFNWKHQRDLLKEEFEKRGITFCILDGEVSNKDRTMNVNLFQGGLVRVCLAHPQSAAHGLTLTKGTSTIWSSPTYNLEHYLQGNRRIYRAGQTEKTETIVVLAAGTIEGKVYMRLKEKDEAQLGLLSLLKED